MSRPEYLKHSYRFQLATVLAVNVAVFWIVIVSHADLSTLWNLLNSLSLQDGIIGLTLPILTFVLDGLLSADAKARIVYCRYADPLPGSRAFSIHLPAERRADPARLTRHWGPFPELPADQNRLWYRIYRSVDADVRIHEAHRAWLFARDLTAYSALFLLLFGVATLMGNSRFSVVAWYFGSLAMQFVGAMISARTYGVRFVRTVLAVASQRSPDDHHPPNPQRAPTS